MTTFGAITNPFPGLVPFEEKDGTRFFGRDIEIQEIIKRLEMSRLLAVIGVSGCGKSSLVRAGVVPVLRVGVADELPPSFQVRMMNPGNDPIGAMRACLGAPPDWPKTSYDLLDFARNSLPAGEGLLLVVDQFEELFRYRADTLALDGGHAAALFVNLLLNATDQREVPLYVLLTMRTDFLGGCAQFRGLPEALNDACYLVPRMTREQQQDAIEKPLEMEGVRIHASLVQRLLNDSSEDPNNLPVLQHVLRRTWDSWCKRDATDAICVRDYEDVGGWKQAIDRDAEEVFQQFPTTSRTAIRRVFQWITDRGVGERPIRRPRPLSECAEVSGIERSQVLQILEAFQTKGLLRRPDEKEDWLVDLTHESVMWQWPRLETWISEESEQGAQVRFLLRSAEQQVPLTGCALESGKRLVGEWLAQPLLAHRYLEEAGRAKIAAWVETSQAIETNKLSAAEARELSAWSAVTSQNEPELSLILGLYSWGKQRSMVAGLEQAMHDAIGRTTPRLTLFGHQASLSGIAWSPDGGRVATTSEDGTAKIWDSRSGQELATLRGHEAAAYYVAWSPDGTQLATASGDHTVRIWESGSGRHLLTLRGHEDEISSVVWSLDGRLATASSDKTARVWNAASGEQLLTLTGHEEAVSDVAWSPDGRFLATAGHENTVRIWDSRRGRQRRVLRGHHGGVAAISWSPDGATLATASMDMTAGLWRMTGLLKRLLPLRRKLVGHRSFVIGAAWSCKGKYLATAGSDNTTRIWNTNDGEEVGRLTAHNGPVRGVCWSPDGTQLATASSDRTARIWDLQPSALRGHVGGVTGVAWAPDGKHLATASTDRTLRLWRASDQQEIRAFSGHEGGVLYVAWSPDGNRIASAGADRTARIWDAVSGRELLVLQGHRDEVNQVLWAPCGQRLATTSDDKTVRIWDAQTGGELLTVGGVDQMSIGAISWSPDGTKLAAVHDGDKVSTWDVATAQQSVLLPEQKDLLLLNAAWSPNGRHVAASASDNTVIVWDVHNKCESARLRGHHGLVFGVVWSQDGRRLATGGADGKAKLWESDSGREVLTLGVPAGPVRAVSLSPDGGEFAFAGAELVYLRPLAPISLLRLVRSRITRPLTTDECHRYLDCDEPPPLPEVT